MKTPSESASPLTTRRLKPSLALGAAALSASAAQGGIVYNNFADLTAGPDLIPDFLNPNDLDGYLGFNLALQTPSSISVSPNNVGGLQFVFRALDNFSKKGKFAVAATSFASNDASSRASNGLLTAGTTMSSSTSVTTFLLPGANLSNVYLGLKIDAGGGNFNYGWVRFSTGPDSPPFGPTSITVLDAAYETTQNAGILVGAVPEPSTAALLTLAGGAVALRRRRKSQAA